MDINDILEKVKEWNDLKSKYDASDSIKERKSISDKQYEVTSNLTTLIVPATFTINANIEVDLDYIFENTWKSAKDISEAITEEIISQLRDKDFEDGEVIIDGETIRNEDNIPYIDYSKYEKV